MAKHSDKSTQAIIEAANEWLLVIHEPEVSAADEQAFVTWLRESPVHVREYLKAEAVFATLEGIDSAKYIDVQALLESDDSVVDLLGPDLSAPGRDTTAVNAPAVAAAREADSVRRIRRPALWATAASVVIAVFAVAFWHTTLPQVDIYTTGLGEQRRLLLNDGSIIDMNTQSTIRVVYTETTRDVRLDQGEALFTVAKDPDRPFIVASKHATVRAIGTQFNVQQRNGEVLVTVLEGRVAVEHASPPIQSGAVGIVDDVSVELEAGDAAEVLPAAPIKTVASVNTERTVAWTERRLIFENETLASVVAEFNRYNPRQLVINDDALSQERISAVFDADKPDALVRFLEQNAGIVVTESQTQLIIQSQE